MTLEKGLGACYSLGVCGRNSAVECFLAKEDVTSSNLVARSAKLQSNDWSFLLPKTV